MNDSAARAVLCGAVLSNRISAALISARGLLPQYGVAEMLYYTRDLPHLTRAALEKILDSPEFADWVANSECVQMLRLAAEDENDDAFWASPAHNPARAKQLRSLVADSACGVSPSLAGPQDEVPEEDTLPLHPAPFEMPIASSPRKPASCRLED